MALMARDSGVQRFLIGRQVMVIFFVFVLARVTTYDQFINDTPSAIAHSVHSVMLNGLLVINITRLTPRVFRRINRYRSRCVAALYYLRRTDYQRRAQPRPLASHGG